MTSIHGTPYSPLSKGRTMNKLRTIFTGTNKATLAFQIAILAWASIFTAQAQSPQSLNTSPTPAFPVESLKLKAKGLRPNTVFSVFLAADCIGKIATNADGRGSMRAEALVDANSLRQNLNPAVLRFASPAGDDVCFARVNDKDQVSPARSASATTTWITSTRSVNDDGSIFHMINWRSVQCVSTF
jgi:hypothetical protein